MSEIDPLHQVVSLRSSRGWSSFDEERGNTPAKALGVPERAELVDLS
jgi:hypothetical protein